MAEAAGPWGRLLRVGGLALVAVGVLMSVAILLHPVYETVTPIIASEVRLVAAHIAYGLSWLLVVLGLPGLWVALGRSYPQDAGSTAPFLSAVPLVARLNGAPFTKRSSTWEH